VEESGSGLIPTLHEGVVRLTVFVFILYADAQECGLAQPYY